MYTVEHWCAGWNLPGYSSDPDIVMHGAELAEAIGYLVEELGFCASSAGDDYEEQDFRTEQAAVGSWNLELIEREARLHGSRGGHWAVRVGGYEYWVMPCFDAACDQVDTEEK